MKSNLGQADNTSLSVLLKASLIVSILAVPALVFMPVVEGYAVNIFYQIPDWYLYAGTAVILFSYICVIWHELNDATRKAFVSFVPVLTICILFPFLPRSLGYSVKYGDHMMHAGTVKDILKTGAIPEIIYPGFLIEMGSLALVTTLPEPLLLDIATSVAILIHVLIFFHLSRLTNVSLSVILIYMPLTLHLTGSVPSSFTYTIVFPFCTWLLFNYETEADSNHQRQRIYYLFIPVLAGLWIYHVVPAVITTIFFALVSITQFVGNSSQILPEKVRSIQIFFRNRPNPVYLLIMSSIIGFLWSTHTILFKRGITQVFSLFVPRDLREPSINTQSIISTLIGDFGLTAVDIAHLVVLKYGGLLVVCMMAGVGVIAISAIPLKEMKQIEMPVGIVILVVFCGIWSLLELGVGIIERLNFLRVLRPVRYLGVITSAAGLLIIINSISHKICANDNETRRTQVIVLFIVSILLATPLAGAAIISYESTYQGPDLYQANRQVLPSDIEGMQWYFTHKSRSYQTTSLWRLNFRYVRYQLRPLQREMREDELAGNALDRGYRAPAHFGYQGNETLLQSIGCRYYIEGKYGRATYQQARPGGKFTTTDFKQLNLDPTIRQIYSNGNMNVSKVGGC